MRWDSLGSARRRTWNCRGRSVELRIGISLKEDVSDGVGKVLERGGRAEGKREAVE